MRIVAALGGNALLRRGERPDAGPQLRDVLAAAAATGSTGPEVEACARCVRATGRPATIGALADARALLDGTAGTTVHR